MTEQYQIKKFKSLLVFLYGAAGCIVYLKFQNFYSPDAISYLAVSEKIIAGEFYNSINAYWSPLISWILVPFLIICKNGILSFQIVNFICGIYLLYLLEKIFRHYAIQKLYYHTGLLALAISLPVLVLLNLTADIIFLVILMQYFYWQTQNKIANTTLHFCLIGVLLFLSKTYGLYFFILHQLVYRFYVSYKSKSLFSFAYFKQFVLFLFICSIWIGILSYKYGQITISTASVYNSAIQQQNGSLQHPCDTMLLISPLPTYTYTAWEEMYQHTKEIIKQQKVTAVSATRLYYNGKAATKFYMKFPRYGLWIFLILLTISLFLKTKLNQLVLPFSLFLIYTSGYLLFFINDRYLFFGAILLYLLNIMLAAFCSKKKKWLQIPVCLLLLYSQLRPAVDYYLYTDTSEEKTGEVIAQFTKSDSTKNIHYASYFPYQFANIAYENKWKNYGGLIGYKQNRSLLLQDLEKYNIHYIILQDSIAAKLQLESVYTKLNPEGLNGVQLWKRN